MERRLFASLVLGTAALSAAVAAQAAPQYGNGYGQGGQVVRCESTNDRYRECRMDTRGGVRIARQLSKTRCEEGRNWGQARDGVWVDRGCRAEFVGGRGNWNGGPGDGQRIRCESNDNRTRTCAIGARGDVRLVRQLSRAQCTEGYSWGQDRNGIWVSRGCRAEFEVHGRGNGWSGGGWNNGGYGQTFRCESDRDRTRVCGVNGRGDVHLVRQLSSAPCVQGRTWGRDARGVWVTAGCRAEFRSR